MLAADATSDRLVDRHGCPAYVSPEILCSAEDGYSGMAADMWSLGVILYTMLAGRYPFQDQDPVVLFSKISVGRYTIPETVSAHGRCLIRGLLRKEPSERLTSADILHHPWLQSCQSDIVTDGETKESDQSVPELPSDDVEDAWMNDM